MLRKVLILQVLCALAVAFPTLSPESTTDLLEWIYDEELTTDGEVTGDQDSIAELDQTTDLETTTDLESTTDEYLDVMQISELSVDLETATASSVEEASEAQDDYDVFLYETFVNEDFENEAYSPRAGTPSTF